MNDLDLVGMEKQAAFDLCKKEGIRCRVRTEDGKAFIGTADYRPDRLNFHIANGKVVSVSRG